MNLLEQLQNAGIPYTENEPMSRRTTFGIGGPALLLHPRTRTQLQTAVSLCRAAGTDPFILGRGSNLLVSDSGIARPVIQLDGDFTAISRQGNTLRCGAGASLIATCRAAAENSLSGLEWGFGIPGSLGGGVYMNAGAYGGELRDVLTEVTFLDETGEYRTLPAAALELSYRHSIFEERPGCVIVEAVLTLTPGEETAIRAAMEDYMSRRREKQPLEYGSAGSTFKRPVGNYASALVDQCGLKGLSVGGAEVSQKHAGFIINRGGATAADVRQLIAEVQRIVREKTGYTLECEIKYAILSPVINHLLFAMPSEAVLPILLIKSSLLAGASALAARTIKSVSLLAILGVVLTYQVIGVAFEWAIVGSFYEAVQDFRIGIPGMLLQWFGGYALLKAIAKL